MKPKLFLFATLVLSIPVQTLASQGGTGQSPHPNQECDTTSVDTWTVAITVTGFNASGSAACTSASRAVLAAMTAVSGVECGPCEGSGCAAVPNAPTLPTVGSPIFNPVTQLYSCESSFVGSFRMSCLPCD